MSTSYLNFTAGRVWLSRVSPSPEHDPALRRSSCGRSAHYPNSRNRLRLNSDFVFATEIKIRTRGTRASTCSCRSRHEVIPVGIVSSNWKFTYYHSNYFRVHVLNLLTIFSDGAHYVHVYAYVCICTTAVLNLVRTRTQKSPRAHGRAAGCVHAAGGRGWIERLAIERAKFSESGGGRWRARAAACRGCHGAITG
jgi:hypothetical protein